MQTINHLTQLNTYKSANNMQNTAKRKMLTLNITFNDLLRYVFIAVYS